MGFKKPENRDILKGGAHEEIDAAVRFVNELNTVVGELNEKNRLTESVEESLQQSEDLVEDISEKPVNITPKTRH